MRHTIFFEVAADRSSGAMLLHVAIVLRQLRIDPKALNWTEMADDKSIIWMLVVQAKSRVRELTNALETTDGVRNVVVQAVGSDESGRQSEGKGA